MRGKDIKLTFPYYLYPKFPFAGYQDVELYNSELLRLRQSMVALNSESNILFHLTVGASMEELDIRENNVEFQWQQLCPVHIRNALKKGIKVVHWIVTPNSVFGGEGSTPYFMNYCKDLDLMKITDKHYSSLTYDYTCMIFNTMLPTIDNRKENSLQLSRVSDFNGNINISNFTQTCDDNIFTVNFYNKLDNLVNRLVSNSGLCTCFSFAVFNISLRVSRINRYSMFPTIDNIYKGRNKMICEWMYSLGCYCVYNFELDEYITYVERDKNMTDGYDIIVENNNGISYKLKEYKN